MTFLQALILGLVEGITEYLPVSSTGHLILAARALGLAGDAVDDFTIIIQGGAILAVLALYRPRIVQMLRGLSARDDDAIKGRRLMVNLIVAFIPAVVLGLLLEPKIDALFDNTWAIVAALALGGVWMILIDRSRKRQRKRQGDSAGDREDGREGGLTIDDLTWPRALLIGLFQCVAMWPGTSRSMMTIAGGTVLGLKPRHAAEFSFLLGLPTLGGACTYKLARNLEKASAAGTPNIFDQLGWLPVLVGVAVAFVSAMLAIRWLVAFLNTHGLAPFGWYRLVLAGVVAVVLTT